MRSAISPRLAISTLSKSCPADFVGTWGVFPMEVRRGRKAPRRLSAYDDEGLAVFDRLTVLDENRLDHTRLVGLDFVHEFHGFNNAQRIAHRDGVADLHEWTGTGRGRPIKGADHRRFDHMPFCRGRYGIGTRV